MHRKRKGQGTPRKRSLAGPLGDDGSDGQVSRFDFAQVKAES